MLLRSTRRAKVIHCFIIDREKAHRRPVLGSHVGNGRTIGERQVFGALPVKLDELPYHLSHAQYLSHSQRKIRCGHAFAQGTFHLHTYDIGRQKINRLPKHPGLRLDTAHTPTDDAQPVDHRRVRVSADKCVRIIDPVCVGEHAAREVLEVDLMHDADTRRHDLERVKRLHAPFEKLVTLTIALELQLQIFVHRILGSGKVHLHRVVHHKIHRHKRLDDLRIFTQALHGRAHRSQVNQQWHAGKIL